MYPSGILCVLCKLPCMARQAAITPPGLGGAIRPGRGGGRRYHAGANPARPPLPYRATEKGAALRRTAKLICKMRLRALHRISQAGF